MKKYLFRAFLLLLFLQFPALASGIEFKARGQWLVTFGGGQAHLSSSTRVGGKRNTPAQEHFTAAQRVRLQLEAIAIEGRSLL